LERLFLDTQKQDRFHHEIELIDGVNSPADDRFGHGFDRDYE
jgi:hypothetical protein